MSIIYPVNTLVDLVYWLSLLSLHIGFQFTSFVLLIYCGPLLLVYFVYFHWCIFNSSVSSISNLLDCEDVFVIGSYLVLSI